MIYWLAAAATCNTSVGNGLVCSDKLPQGDPTIEVFLNIALGMLGAIAFLMVVIGGLRYITNSASNNPNGVSEAKKMIIYSVVGMVVAGLAFAIVNFVLGSTK